MKQRFAVALVVVVAIFFSSAPIVFAYTASEPIHTEPLAFQVGSFISEMRVAHLARPLGDVDLVDGGDTYARLPFGRISGPVLMNQSRTHSIFAGGAEIDNRSIRVSSNTNFILVLTYQGGRVNPVEIDEDRLFTNVDPMQGQRLFYNATGVDVTVTSNAETFTLSPGSYVGRTHPEGMNALRINAAGTPIFDRSISDNFGARRLIVVAHGSTDAEVEAFVSTPLPVRTSETAYANTSDSGFFFGDHPVSGNTASLRILNNSGETLCGFYARNSDQTSWGINLLEKTEDGDPHMYYGDQVILTTRRPGYYDFLFVSCSGARDLTLNWNFNVSGEGVINPSDLQRDSYLSGPVRLPTASGASSGGSAALSAAPLPSAAQHDQYNSVWGGLNFVNLYYPGMQTYSQTLSPGSYRWTFMWCGTDANHLQQILAPFSIRFYVNDVEIPISSFLVYPWRSNCQAWSTVLSGWQSGRQYTLDTRYHLSAGLPPNNDPGDVGDYTQRVIVTVP